MVQELGGVMGMFKVCMFEVRVMGNVRDARVARGWWRTRKAEAQSVDRK